jgi:hypothetical protein
LSQHFLNGSRSDAKYSILWLKTDENVIYYFKMFTLSSAKKNGLAAKHKNNSQEVSA